MTNKATLEKFAKISLIAIGAAGIAAGISYCVDSSDKIPACMRYDLPAGGYVKTCTIDTNNDGKKDTDLEQHFHQDSDGKIDYIVNCEYEIGGFTPRKCGIDWNADGIVDQWDFPPGREPKGIFL